MSKLFSLEGRSALITGGSRGIGRMIAQGFLAHGARVYISARKAEACNRTAAELSGINAVKVVWFLYILVGVFAALAGMARASYMSLGDPLSGDGMELTCISAVLLGGTAFSGGEGSVAKTMVGALIVISITTGLMTVIPAYWQVLATGSVLLIAVVLNHLLVREPAK